MERYSLETERAALGIVLIDPKQTVDFITHITPKEFYSRAHTVTAEAITELFQSGQRVDIVTVMDHLQTTNRVNDIYGGKGYLLDVINSDLSVSNLIQYLESIRKYAHLRDLSFRFARLNAQVQEATDPHLFLELARRDVQEALESISKTSRLPTLGDSVKALISQTKAKVIGPLSTGYHELDRMLNGGLRSGELIMIGGRPGNAKTSLGLNIANNNYHTGTHFVSLEMPKEQLIWRLLAMESGIPAGAEWTSSVEREIMKASELVSSKHILIDDKPAQGIMHIYQSAMESDRYFRSMGKKLGLLVIDYLGLIKASGNVFDERQATAQNAKGVKWLARQLQVPVICLAQLNRNVEHRENKRPMLSDFRETGTIEEHADIVIFLYRQKYYERQQGNTEYDDDTAELIVSKHRMGQTGTVRLIFNESLTKFEESLLSREI